MKTATSYLHFDGNCRQAMTFYQKCWGGDLQLNAYPDAQGQPSADPGAPIMHGQILAADTPFLMASDGPPGGADMKQGTNFSIAIECTSPEEIDRLFAALGENGKVRMPLSDVPWGARFGMLTDQFGVQWMLNFTLPPPKG